MLFLQAGSLSQERSKVLGRLVNPLNPSSGRPNLCRRDALFEPVQQGVDPDLASQHRYRVGIGSLHQTVKQLGLALESRDLQPSRVAPLQEVGWARVVDQISAHLVGRKTNVHQTGYGVPRSSY